MVHYPEVGRPSLLFCAKNLFLPAYFIRRQLAPLPRPHPPFGGGFVTRPWISAAGDIRRERREDEFQRCHIGAHRLPDKSPKARRREAARQQNELPPQRCEIAYIAGGVIPVADFAQGRAQPVRRSQTFWRRRCACSSHIALSPINVRSPSLTLFGVARDRRQVREGTLTPESKTLSARNNLRRLRDARTALGWPEFRARLQTIDGGRRSGADSFLNRDIRSYRYAQTNVQLAAIATPPTNWVAYRFWSPTTRSCRRPRTPHPPDTPVPGPLS
jgi:hypothetical protein